MSPSQQTPVRSFGSCVAKSRLGTRRGVGAHCALAFAALLSLTGCADVQTMRPDVAVTLGGEEVLYSEFEGYLQRHLADADFTLDAATESALLDQFIDAELLVRLAIERGLVRGEVDQRRAVDYLLRDFGDQPTEREARAYYSAHRSNFELPEQVHLRLILTPDRATAQVALAALEAGGDFAEVAAQFSHGPTGHLGGDQGRLSRADLPPSYAAVIFGLEPGEISPIVKADYGYQIFQVTQRHIATESSFEEAHAKVQDELWRLRVDDQVAKLLDEARGRYNVRIFRGNLPFDYQGTYAPSHSP